MTKLAPPTAPDDLRMKHPAGGLSNSPHSHSRTISRESINQPADDAGFIFKHAPISLWEEDFSEVKRRFDLLKRNGVEDLWKHFKKHPEEVLSLARMVRLVRVNNETLRIYDAEGPSQFRDGLSLIFNKESFEGFKEELITFWKGRTWFTCETVNTTLTGMSKNIMIHASIPPGFEHTWARVYIAITDITSIKENMRSLVASDQKYRSVFDTLQTAIVLADAPSGMIVETNKSAKRLFGASNGGLVGLHLIDLVSGEEKDKVRALLRHEAELFGHAGPVLHVHHKSNGTITVHATANTIEVGDASVIVLSFTPANEAAPARSDNRKARDHHADLARKITQRECEILRLICSGKTSRVIANQLCISHKTVKTHRASIMQKLDKHCVADLVKFAMTNGLAELQ